MTENDSSNLNEIIPISFDMHKILENNLNNLGKNNNFGNGKYLIQMHSQAKTSGIKLPEVYGVGKSLDPNLRPEKTKYLSQTRKIRENMNRSRKSQIKDEET